MRHYVLIYDLAQDYLDRRPLFREAHLQKALAAVEREELVLGGALTDPVDTAMLLFRADTADRVEDFARSDPYVLNGLVRQWKVREWRTVVGDHAAAPVKL